PIQAAKARFKLLKTDSGGMGAQEETGPDGQRPGFPFEGGEGAQTAATASSGSRERMRGLTQARFERVPAAAVGLERFGVSFRMGQDADSWSNPWFRYPLSVSPRGRCVKAPRQPHLSLPALFRTFQAAAGTYLRRPPAPP